MISLFTPSPIDPKSVKLISKDPLIVEVTPPKASDPVPENDPAPVKPRNRLIETISYLGKGAAFGYGIYWLFRLGDKLGFVSEASRPLINPYGYVLTGLILNAINQTASLTYEAALAILGERIKYDNKVLPENSPRLERFRQYSWKVITKIENTIEKVDAKFSEVCGIRTAKEISTLEAPLNKDQILILKLKEIFRRTLGEELKQIFSNLVPFGLALYCVKALGFAVVGAPELFGAFGIMMIVISLAAKILLTFNKHDELDFIVTHPKNQQNSPLNATTTNNPLPVTV